MPKTLAFGGGCLPAGRRDMGAWLLRSSIVLAATACALAFLGRAFVTAAPVQQHSERLPGSAGPRVEFLNKKPVGVELLDVAVEATLPTEAKAPTRVLPSGTKRVRFVIRTRGVLPEGTRFTVDTVNEGGPVEGEGTWTLLYKTPAGEGAAFGDTSLPKGFADRYGEATLMLFPPDLPFPDGPYRATVTIGGVKAALLNWSVGGPGPPASPNETTSHPRQNPAAVITMPKGEPQPDRAVRDEGPPPAAAGPPIREPTAFKKVDYCAQHGGKVKERKAQLIIDPGRRLLIFADEDQADRLFQTVPWDRITNITYEYTEHTRVKTAIIIPFSLFLKGKKHWLTITYGPGDQGEPGGAVLTRLDGKSYQAILATLNGETGIEVRQVGAEGNIWVLYEGSPVRAQPTQQEADVAPRSPDSPSQVEDDQVWSDDRIRVTLDRLEVGETPSEEVEELLTQTTTGSVDWKRRKWESRRRVFVILSLRDIRGVHLFPHIVDVRTRLRDQRGKKHKLAYFAIRPVRAVGSNGRVTEGFSVPFEYEPVQPGLPGLPSISHWSGWIFQRAEPGRQPLPSCWISGGSAPLAFCFAPGAEPEALRGKGNFMIWVPPKATILLIFNVPEGAEPRGLTLEYHYFMGWDGKTLMDTGRGKWAKIEIEFPGGVSP